MENKKLINNSITIENELNWFSKLIDNRLNIFFENKDDKSIPPPNIENDESNYAIFLKTNSISPI